MRFASMAPVLLAVLGATGFAHAQDVTWRTQVGTPEVAVVEGRAIAWRNVVMRAASGAFSVEATLPVCSDGPRAAPAMSPLDRAGSGCLASNGSLALPPVGPEVEAKVRLPRLVRDGPDVNVALRRWNSSRAWRSDGGAEVDVEVSKGAGPFFFYGGQATPVATGPTGEGWRATYAGAKVRPARGHVVEVEFERETAIRSGLRSRDVTVRYAYAGSSATRAKAWITRADSDARDWRAGVGVDWNF